MVTTPKQRFILSVMCISIGLFLFLVALELIPGATPQEGDAPNAIIALSALVFVIGGCMILLGQESRTNDLLAAVMCVVFGVVGGWIAVFAPTGGFSGGLPFLSSAANEALARVFFGAGSLLCFGIAAWALKRFRR
jgi:hypothetical protein